ncbi:MAG: ABC transporter permease, partial [Bacteroidetes bacterium CG_4_10_14_3_um_filter_42_6]
NSMEPDRFWNIGLYAYVLLNSNSNIESIFEKFPGFYEKYMKSLGDQLNASFDLKATRLDKVHLTSKLAADLPTGNIAYIKIFSIVASFILLLASINYMNMATARATKRAKEVGLRKVIGADRYQLIIQFISEALLLTFIAYLLSLLITSMLLADFNTLSGKAFTFSGIATPDFLLLIFGISVIIGIISGSYPAFYLSSF